MLCAPSARERSVGGTCRAGRCRVLCDTIKPALACRLHITPHSNIGAVHILTGIGGELEHVQFPVMEHTNGDPVA